MVHWSLVSGVIGTVLMVAASVLGWYWFPRMISKKVVEVSFESDSILLQQFGELSM